MSAFSGTVLITGGTAGVGFEAALIIARSKPDYQIVIASRNNTNDASKRINDSTGNKNVLFMPLDLETTTAVRDFASRYNAASFPPLKALLLNAGLQFPNELKTTKEGYEITFAINNLGHTLLYHLLQPSLARDARIVLTASGTHDPAQKTGHPDAVYTTAGEVARPPAEARKNWSGRQRYATSKLCNVLWTYALARRLEEANRVDGADRTATAFDPGLMPGTGLAREYNPVVKFVWAHVLPRLIPLLRVLVMENIHTTAESGAALARLGIGEDVKGISGKYFEGTKVIESSVDSRVVEKQEDLWNWNIKTLSVDGTEAGIRTK